jgi:hypothetical protein
LYPSPGYNRKVLLFCLLPVFVSSFPIVFFCETEKLVLVLKRIRKELP